MIPSETFSVARVRRELEFLDTDDAKAQMRRARSFRPPTDEASPHAQLAAWAEWDFIALSKTVDALSDLDALLQAVEREAKAVLKSSGGSDIVAAVKDLQSDLDRLAKKGTI